MILCTPDLKQQNYTDKKMVFLADTRLGSKRTLNVSKHPFPSTAGMDKYLSKAWNKTIAPNAIINHYDYEVFI